MSAHEKDLQAQVAAFHRAFDLPILPHPQVPSDDRVRMRMRLIAEEFFETLEAVFGEGALCLDDRNRLMSCIDVDDIKVDLPEFADGLADLDYVVEGCRLEFGINRYPIAAEVQRANMAKVGGPTREDGKRLKPPGWTPPNIAGVLEAQCEESAESLGEVLK